MTLVYNLAIQRIGKALRSFHLHLPGLTLYHNVFQLPVVKMLAVGVGRENPYKAHFFAGVFFRPALYKMRGFTSPLGYIQLAGGLIKGLNGAAELCHVVPGAGNMLTRAINAYDNGVIVGMTLFYAVLTVTSIILGDILMSVMDPRISFTAKER